MRGATSVGTGLFALLVAATANAAETVAIVTATPDADEAARYLSNQVDHPVVRRNSVNARNRPALKRITWRGLASQECPLELTTREPS